MNAEWIESWLLAWKKHDKVLLVINRTNEALIATIYKGRLNESRRKWKQGCGWIGSQKEREDKFNKQKSTVKFKSVCGCTKVTCKY